MFDENRVPNLLFIYLYTIFRFIELLVFFFIKANHASSHMVLKVLCWLLKSCYITIFANK